MNLPPPLASLARLLRRDMREIKEAIQEQTRATHDAAESAHEQAKAANQVVVSSPPNETFVVEVHPKDDKGQATQASVKRATWLAAWGAWGAVLAASVYAGISAYQLKEMRVTNEQTRRQWEADHRPWLGMDNIALTSVSFSSQRPSQINVHVEGTMALKNFGGYPAFDASADVEPVIPIPLESWTKKPLGRPPANSVHLP
jgi:hypothetical protein